MPAYHTVAVRHLYNIVCPIATFSRLPILDREIKEAFPSGPRMIVNGTGTSGQTAGGGPWRPRPGDIPGLAVARPPAAFPGSRAG